MNEINEFISKFTIYLRETGYDKSKIDRFKYAMRKVITEILPERDNQNILVVRDFITSKSLHINLYLEDLWVCTNNGRLEVGTFKPIWSRGLSRLSRDSDVIDIISWFLHFSEQYILRAKHINLIGALGIVYGIYSDFRGEKLSTYVYPRSFVNSYCEFRGATFRNNNVKRSVRDLSFWYKHINSFDPIINRLIFNYNKSLELRENNFSEEALVALDKTINVGEQYFRRFMPQIQGDIRNEMILFFFNDITMSKWFNYIYKLRCYFGAHPSLSKWWDFEEIYSDDIDYIFDITRILVMKILLHEFNNRIITYGTSSNSTWFIKNCSHLWDNCWFGKIPIRDF